MKTFEIVNDIEVSRSYDGSSIFYQHLVSSMKTMLGFVLAFQVRVRLSNPFYFYLFFMISLHSIVVFHAVGMGLRNTFVSQQLYVSLQKLLRIQFHESFSGDVLVLHYTRRWKGTYFNQRRLVSSLMR